MSIKGISRHIKWAWQRIFRGYDDRIFWGFDDYFAYTIIPALKRFCLDELKEMDIDNNLERARVYCETLRRIRRWEKQSWEEEWEGSRLKDVAVYFAVNIGWYWN